MPALCRWLSREEDSSSLRRNRTVSYSNRDSVSFLYVGTQYNVDEELCYFIVHPYCNGVPILVWWSCALQRVSPSNWDSVSFLHSVLEAHTGTLTGGSGLRLGMFTSIISDSLQSSDPKGISIKDTPLPRCRPAYRPHRGPLRPNKVRQRSLW